MNRIISTTFSEKLLDSGAVCINSGRSSRAVLSEALTTYAAGYKPGNVRSVREFIAPTVSAPERFEYHVLGKGAFLTEKDVVRSAGGEFKRLTWEADKNLAQTLEKGLTLRIDRRNRTEGCEEEAVDYLINRLDRIDLLSAYQMLSGAADLSKEVNWTGENPTPPDVDVKRALEAMATAIGLRGNRCLLGSEADMNRSAHYESSKNNASAAHFTPEEMAKRWAIEKAHVLVEMIEDLTGKKKIGDPASLLLFFGQDTPSKWDSSTLKTFTSGDSEYSVFREERSTGVDITVWHENIIVNTIAGGAYKLKTS